MWQVWIQRFFFVVVVCFFRIWISSCPRTTCQEDYLFLFSSLSHFCQNLYMCGPIFQPSLLFPWSVWLLWCWYYTVLINMCACYVASVMSNSLWPHGPVPRQAPLSMGFPRQEYWSGLPLPSPGDLPDSGIEPVSLRSSALADRFFTTSATWEAPWLIYFYNNSWNQVVLALQLCSSFFRVVCVDFLCISIWSLESGSLFVQKAFWHFDLACVEYMDQFGEYWHVNNIKYSDPTTKCTFRFGCGGLVAQLCLILGIPCTWEISRAVSHQSPLSMWFSRQEYWLGLPFPFPGDRPDSGMESGSPA